MEEKMIRCPACKESMAVPAGRDRIFCMFCGEPIWLNEEDKTAFSKEEFSGQLESLLEGYGKWTKEFSRESYPASFRNFQEEHKAFLREVDRGILQEKKETLVELIVEQAGEVHRRSSQAEKARQVQFGLNTFMAVYIIPAILESRNDKAKIFCEELKEAWSASFKDSRIKVSDHETILKGFNKSFLESWFKWG